MLLGASDSDEDMNATRGKTVANNSKVFGSFMAPKDSATQKRLEQT